MPELLRRLSGLFDAEAEQACWTAILVDDGSRDDSVEQIEAKCARDGRFRLIGLSRNFGFQAALLAGLEQAKVSESDAVLSFSWFPLRLLMRGGDSDGGPRQARSDVLLDCGVGIGLFHRVLKPGGVAVITVPASMLLWSDWDVSMHHFRRYDRKGLLALVPKSDWEVLHANYTNALAFLPALLVRKWRSRKPIRPENEQSRAEYRIPPRWLNSLLKWIFVKTAMWQLPMPFGISLLLVVRKKG